MKSGGRENSQLSSAAISNQSNEATAQRPVGAQQMHVRTGSSKLNAAVPSSAKPQEKAKAVNNGPTDP